METQSNVLSSLFGNIPKVITAALDQHAIVSIADRQGIIVAVNDKFCAISGYSREELIGKNHRIVNSGYHDQEFFNQMWETIASGNPWNGEIRNKRKDGSFYWVDSTIVPSVDVEGRITHYFSIRTDITKQKEDLEDQKHLNAELSIHREELRAQNAELAESFERKREAEKRYQNLFNSSSTAFLVVDRNRKIVDINYAFSSLINKPFAFVSGKPASFYLDSQLLYSKAQLADISDGHTPKWTRSIIKRKGADPIPVRIGFTQISNDDDSDILISIADITDEIAAEKASASAMEDKNRFIANMSHEIRTPMHGVVGNLSMAMDRGDFSEDTKRNLSLAIDCSKHLQRILNDILDYSKMGDKTFTLLPEPTNIRQLVLETIELFRPLAQKKQINLDLNADELPDKRIYVDPERLRQVLSNLISNAIKFTSEGTVTVKAYWVKRVADQDYGTLTLAIIDSGVGIDKSEIDRLMEPFTQRNTSRTKDAEGTGLGLSIVKMISELMRGHIYIDSELGKGSSFTFEALLPDVVNQHDDNISESDNQHKESSPSSINTILLVDDSPMNRLVGRQMCEQLGLKVIEANDGSDALQQLSAHEEIELVLMDIQMPVMDGVEATKQIRQEPKWDQVPIVAMTANVHANDRKEYLEVGMRAVLPKPFQLSDLENLIQNISN